MIEEAPIPVKLEEGEKEIIRIEEIELQKALGENWQRFPTPDGSKVGYFDPIASTRSGRNPFWSPSTGTCRFPS